MADKIKTAMMFYDIEDSTIGSGLFVAVGRFRDGTVLRTEPALSYKAVSTALGERLDAFSPAEYDEDIELGPFADPA